MNYDTLKNNNSHKTQEQKIILLGKSIFESISNPPFYIFNKKQIYKHLMNWTMVSPLIKSALFRFVDVFPILKKPAVPFFLSEYLNDIKTTQNKWIIFFIKKIISILPNFLLSAFISKQITQMANIFIVGKSLKSTLPAIKLMQKNNCAFTVDLLGEESVSLTEVKIYQQRYLQIIDQLHKEFKNINKPIPTIPIVNISIKISCFIFPLYTVAWEDTKKRIKNELRILFQKAINTNTFINIDMEKYEYKNLTLEIFKELLTEQDFKNYPHFGIVIQAYLKDSLQDLKDIYHFIKKRQCPITIRLVKGAYWDYELIHSKQNNWPCPVFLKKSLSDINFETCADFILQSHPILYLSVGSHNIRSISYALYKSQQLNIPKKDLEIQVLYGMADNIKDCLIHKGWRVRQYCPIGEPIPGIAYLVRRLLENTANESFIKNWNNKKYNIIKLLQNPY